VNFTTTNVVGFHRRESNLPPVFSLTEAKIMA